MAVFGTGTGILKGMAITLRHLFRPPVTVQYPDERLVVHGRYRGELLWYDDHCTSCNTCAKACPNGCITVQSHMGEDGRRVNERYEIDFALCMLCGFCVETCPFDAIRWGTTYDVTSYSRKDLYWDKVALTRRVQEIG